VDRGAHQLECVTFLFALKAVYPEQITLLRGNHEFRDQNESLGESGVCVRVCACVCVCVCVCVHHTDTHTHTHTHIKSPCFVGIMNFAIRMSPLERDSCGHVCVCLCVCV